MDEKLFDRIAKSRGHVQDALTTLYDTKETELRELLERMIQDISERMEQVRDTHDEN